MKDWRESRCHHLVMAFDSNNGVQYLHEGFASLFWKKVFPENRGQFSDHMDAECLVELEMSGEIPEPGYLAALGFVRVHQISSHFGDWVIECAFVSDEFLEEADIG